MKRSAFEQLQHEIVACERCPELRRYCARIAIEKKRAYAAEPYWGRPVPAFGNEHARLLLVGLAPGAHGSNRTGRMFTGDASGDFLYPALYRSGFATQPLASGNADGLQLIDCAITAALRCAPPFNKPTPHQLRRCHPYLVRELRELHELRVVVGLGSIGTTAALRALADAGYAPKGEPLRFGHGAECAMRSADREIAVIASFHPSRQNTNTGKLTAPMFDAIFTRARAML